MRTIESLMADVEFVKTLPKSRAEAKALGAKVYYNGPCKWGHESYRKTINSACCKCLSLSTAKRQSLIPPELLSKYREMANINWNNSDRGRTAKDRWKDKDPKWAWVVSALGGARGRTEGSEIPFDITNAYVYSILPTACPVFGTPFIFRGNKKVGPESPTLDRIVPALGYVEGNIAVISMKANAIKSNANAEEIQKVADWLKLQETKI